MPDKYLLQVHTQPTGVSAPTWEQWYTEEHIRDVIYFQVAKTGAVYRANSDVPRSQGIDGTAESLSLNRMKSPSAVPPDGNDFKRYLAIYQTKHRHCLQQPAFKDHVRLTSELWGGEKTVPDIATTSPQDLELVDVVGSKMQSTDAAPHLIYCKISGPHVGSWLRPEHIEAASQLEGYRRTLVYRPVSASRPKEGDSMTTNAPAELENDVLFMHEFEGAGHGEGLESVKEALEAIDGSEGFSMSLRSWELFGSEGFDGKCRKPERRNDG